MGFYYAVAKGRKPGIYQTWDECKAQVDKFPAPVFKKFHTSAQAQAFIDSRSQCLQKDSTLSNAANATRSVPKPSHVVPLGRTGTRAASKRAWESPERNKNSLVALAKRKKTDDGTGKTNKHFDMDHNGWVSVYTDGACSSNGTHGAMAGVGVYFGDDSPLNVSEPVIGRATNNMAEIQAVTRAAEKAHEAGITKMRIYTDSEFLIKSVTQWMPGWKRRGWTTAASKPVVNRQELQEMESALKPFKVEWNHVRGHRGIYGNEQADRLAREGARRYRK